MILSSDAYTIENNRSGELSRLHFQQQVTTDVLTLPPPLRNIVKEYLYTQVFVIPVGDYDLDHMIIHRLFYMYLFSEKNLTIQYTPEVNLAHLSVLEQSPALRNSLSIDLHITDKELESLSQTSFIGSLHSLYMKINAYKEEAHPFFPKVLRSISPSTSVNLDLVDGKRFLTQPLIEFIQSETFVPDNFSLTLSDYINLGQMPAIKHLEFALYKCPKVDLIELVALENIHLLDIVYEGIDFDNHEIYLQLTKPKQIRLTLNKVTDAILPSFSILTNLIYLDLDTSPITDAGLANFSHPTLTSLSLSKNAHISDSTILQLPTQCPNLAELLLFYTPSITYAAVSHLSSLGIKVSKV